MLSEQAGWNNTLVEQAGLINEVFLSSALGNKLNEVSHISDALEAEMDDRLVYFNVDG